MTDERKVWVVSGTCGEYSDRQTWLVRAHDSEAEATAEATRLTAAYQACRDTVYGASQAMRDAMRAAGDEQFASDYTGTEYYVTEVPARFAQ